MSARLAKELGKTLAALGLLTGLALPAAAQCTDPAPASGSTVTCSNAFTLPANTPAVTALSGSTGVTVTADTTAAVSASHTTAAALAVLSVDTDSFITNSGTLALSGAGLASARGVAMLGVSTGNQLNNTATGTITTNGAYNFGMAVSSNNNALTNDGTITTSGGFAYGMAGGWLPSAAITVVTGNTLTNNGFVQTTGSQARAVSVVGSSNNVVNNADATVTTTGSSSDAIYLNGANNDLDNYGTITASGGSLSGNHASAGVYANMTNTANTTTIYNYPGGQIISAQGEGIHINTGGANIINAGLVQSNATPPVAIAGNAPATATGAINLTLRTGSVLIGDADGGNGSNNVFLEGRGTVTNAFRNFQTLTVNASPSWNWADSASGQFSSVDLQTGTLNLSGTLSSPATPANLIVENPGAPAVLNMLGVDQTFDNLSNAGIIYADNTGPASNPHTRLTITGAYSGDGQIVLNTSLGDDSSASDRIVFAAGASVAPGTLTTLVINNTPDGLGAQTSDGILVVQAPASVDTTGAFQLAGTAVLAGNYKYTLQQGGCGASPAPALASNWYLCSSTPAFQATISKIPTSATRHFLAGGTPVYVAVPDNTVTYQITVENTDTLTIGAGTTVEDAAVVSVPGLTPQSWTCTVPPGSLATCGAPSGSGALQDTPTFPPGSSLVYTFVALVDHTPPAVISNNAIITLPSGGGTRNDSVALPTAPIVSIFQNTSDTQAPSGGKVTYTVTVMNGSTVPADGFIVTDSLPTGVTAMSWTCEGSACARANGSGPLDETLSSFPAGASAVYTITATVDSAPPSATITNTARIAPPSSATVASLGLCDPVSCQVALPLPTAPAVSTANAAPIPTLARGPLLLLALLLTSLAAVALPLSAKRG